MTCGHKPTDCYVFLFFDETVTRSRFLNMEEGEDDLCCKEKRHTATNPVYYRWARLGLSQFAEGTATH